MRPLVYVDIRVTGVRHDGVGPATPPRVCSALMKVLHGAFSQSPGTYAVALPGENARAFSVIRVFAERREDLDQLVERTEAHPLFTQHTRFGYPKAVPEDFAGEYREYHRYRIPTRKADRRKEGQRRLRRILHADEAKLPYFVLQSRSNRSIFGLRVECRPGARPDGDCVPDNYGLSVTTRSFAVPHIPL